MSAVAVLQAESSIAFAPSHTRFSCDVESAPSAAERFPRFFPSSAAAGVCAPTPAVTMLSRFHKPTRKLP